jgi:carnitine-CoA ligase
MSVNSQVFDHRIPARKACVLGYLLERWAKEQPDEVAIIFHEGPSWTWRETLDQTRRIAKALSDLGVTKGDHVLSWQPNGPEAILTWFGLNYLGAVYVPLNTAYKGGILEHQVRISDARLIVCHAELAPRLNDIDTVALTDLVIVGNQDVNPSAIAGLTTHPASTLMPSTGLTEMPEAVNPWDTQYIIFTSGTTGPSKAVLSSYLQGYEMGPVANPRYNSEDRILVNLPLFHVGGTVFPIIALATGGSCVIDSHFRTHEFWSTVREHKITVVCLLAAMAPFLLNLPEFEGEQDHTLRTTIIVPWTEEAMLVAERYKLDAMTTFNMTEVSSPLMSDLHPNIPGLCGKVRPGIEARVVDDNDCEVAPGQVGELVLRSNSPWAMNHGYYKNPEATAKAWRNGWFHTGDGFRYDEDGNFFFVDRIKDAIRRRGENISSFEVENEVVAHPDIAEAAAIPVPSELGEDDVMIVVAPVNGATIDSKQLFEFLVPRMAHFMLPRYIRVIAELPKTPTQKVQKHLLKSDGVTADTWDREDAGIEIKRERIG